MKKEKLEFKCPICGLVCLDETSLKRHMDWAHFPKPRESKS